MVSELEIRTPLNRLLIIRFFKCYNKYVSTNIAKIRENVGVGLWWGRENKHFGNESRQFFILFVAVSALTTDRSSEVSFNYTFGTRCVINFLTPNNELWKTGETVESRREVIKCIYYTKTALWS